MSLKSRRRPRPSQHLDIGEEGRIGAKDREPLEQQRELAPFAEHVGGKVLDPAVSGE